MLHYQQRDDNMEDKQEFINSPTPKKSRSMIYIVGGIVLLIILFVAGYFVLNQKPTTVTQQVQEVNGSEVKITSTGFEPATIQVTKGTQVTWTNTDEADHEVASDPHPTHTGLPGLDA